jgi:hypothetical protein
MWRGGFRSATGENGIVRLQFRRPNLQLLAVSLVIAICLVAMVYGVSVAVTGRDALHLPPTIENIEPIGGGSGVPAQTSVLVDMKAGYTGVLVIDGLELETVNREDLQDRNKPGQQIVLPPTVIYDPGNATLSFAPTEKSVIKEFTQGEHTVKVIYWKVTEDRSHSKSYAWSFNVF